jgi:hypothetical protein
VFRVVLIVLAGLTGGLTRFGGDCRHRVSSGLVWLEEYLDDDDERSIDERVRPGREIAFRSLGSASQSSRYDYDRRPACSSRINFI